EPQALTAAVNAISSYLVAIKIADGSGTLAAVTDQALTGGTDPTVTGESYVTGFARLEAETWNALVIDSEEPSVQASLQAFVFTSRESGKRVIGVVGEPTSVELDVRMANARAFNDPAIIYVGNGFVSSAGETI